MRQMDCYKSADEVTPCHLHPRPAFEQAIAFPAATLMAGFLVLRSFFLDVTA